MFGFLILGPGVSLTILKPLLKELWKIVMMKILERRSKWSYPPSRTRAYASQIGWGEGKGTQGGF
jgi:hypothetical protein